MQTDSSFRVDVPVDDAWAALLDLDRVVRCLPGAQLDEIAGDEYRGTLTVEVGPIAASYRGTTHIESSDGASHTAIVVASGHESDGHGDATASIKVVLRSEGGGTRIDVDTDLVITGKIAALEGSALSDAWERSLARLIENVAQDVLRPDVVDLTSADDEPPADAPGPGADAESDELVAEAVAASTEPAAAPSGNGAAVHREDHGTDVQIEVIEVGGTPVLRRLAPVAGLLVTVVVVRCLIRRRSRS